LQGTYLEKADDFQLKCSSTTSTPMTIVFAFASIHMGTMAGLPKALADYYDLHNGTICNRTWSTAVHASIQRTPPIMLTKGC
jgi:hypothetical protein